MKHTGFTIPDDWTPEQAMAVVDLLDTLREQIWAIYDIHLLDAYREDRQPVPIPTTPPDDPPF